MMKLPYAEPFKIKMIESIRRSTRQEREKWIREAKYNLFNLKSEQVYIDFITDSGTGAMSDKQWAEIMLGDESYAGSASFYKLQKTIKDLLGFDYVLPTHQGRGAENVLFSTILKEDDVVPGNAHFDTTKGHIEFRKAHAIDCIIPEAFDTAKHYPFKGNMDVTQLEDLLKAYSKDRIPCVILTLTCNSCGGQPVSMQNIKDTYALTRKYGTRLIFDAARFAENAYFIKIREQNYAHKPIREIVKEMFSYADAMTMSSKKDGIVNIGGFIAFKEEELYKQASGFNIVYEGYVTYGGMAGRDMGALAQGLKESTEFDYLEARVEQVAYLGNKLKSFGIPVQEPFGGHAIYVDAKKFLPHLPQEQFQAQTLGIELYVEAGVRGVEIGTLLADRDPITRDNRYPLLELLRLAIPRRVYTNNHMDYVATALGNVYERRKDIKTGFKITQEAPMLRHFTVELEKITAREKEITLL